MSGRYLEGVWKEGFLKASGTGHVGKCQVLTAYVETGQVWKGQGKTGQVWKGQGWVHDSIKWSCA